MSGRAADLAALALLMLAALALALRAPAWLWLGTLAAGLLLVYARLGVRPLLVVGAPLAGLAMGLLLGPRAAALVGIGAGFFVVDRLEPARSRWVLSVAAVFVALGLLLALIDIGPVGLAIAGLAATAGTLVFVLERRVTRGWHYTAPTSSQARPPLRVAPALESALRAPVPVHSASPGEAPRATSPESEVVKNAVAGREDIQAAEAERDAALSAEDTSLYRRLETWRKSRARREDKPAYIVLGNASLRQIARDRPRTLDELSRVKGIGPVKLERYGAEIVALVQEAHPAQDTGH